MMPGLSLGLGLGLQRRATASGGGPTPDPLALSGTPVTTATEDEAYDGFTVSASGGTAPYTYSLVGTWPAGISINSSTGAVTGTPTESGSFTGLSVRVTDAASATDDLDAFVLDVEAGQSFAKTDSFVSSAFTGTSVSTVSTGSLSLGTYEAGRKTYIALGWRRNSTNRQVNSVSIGGVSATRIVRTVAGATQSDAEIWVADTGAGSALEGVNSAAITVTFSGDAVAAALAVFKGVGYSITASATNAGASSATATIPANGLAIGAFVNQSNAAGSINNVTEELNTVLVTSNRVVAGWKTSAGGESVTSTFGGTTSTPRFSMAAFGPS